MIGKWNNVFYDQEKFQHYFYPLCLKQINQKLAALRKGFNSTNLVPHLQ